MSFTNLPSVPIEDSAASTKLFFDTYGREPLQFNVNDAEAAIAFFTGRGFDSDAAIITASTLLTQAKLDEVPIFQLLDTLKGLTAIELNFLIAQILNNNRGATSTLGFRSQTSINANQIRNISA
jgi:hypothetical protein